MIAITVDCEQWNAPLLRGRKDPANDNTEYSYEGNKKILEILAKHKISATFFTTSFFAERHPKQIKEISKKHEIASHGHSHTYRISKELDIEKDIKKSKKVIEKIIGKKIIGFRAPQVQFSSKLIHVLEKLDFRYDSSIHSAWLPGFYNHRDKPLKPHLVGKIVEIPASASHTLRLPFNWIFMRNLPLSYSVKIVNKLLKKRIIPVTYLHSWEFHNFKSKAVPFYITRNIGDKFCMKFEKFLNAFKNERFVTMTEIYEDFGRGQEAKS
jgi:peptidoglycan/xylan/chitin deacetylase (PgdA/CDA1 family)